MKTNIESLADKTLKRMASFVRPEDAQQESMRAGAASEGSVVIGVYKNPADTADVVIVSTGIVVLGNEGSDRFVAYDEITGVDVDGPKQEASEMALVTRSGKVALPVLGHSERSRDIFEFQRFLVRACRLA